MSAIASAASSDTGSTRWSGDDVSKCNGEATSDTQCSAKGGHRSSAFVAPGGAAEFGGEGCDVARAKAISGNQFGAVSDFGFWVLHSGFGFWVQVKLGSATMVKGRKGVMVVNDVCPFCLWG